MSLTCLSCFSTTPVRSTLQQWCSIPRTFVTVAKARTPREHGATTLIVDTDAGFDDLLTISALKSKKTADMPFISTVGGMQDNPVIAARFLKHLFPDTALQVVPGDNKQSGHEAVPEWLQNFRKILDSMMQSSGIEECPQEEEKEKKRTNNTSVEVAEFLTNHTGSVDIMCLGPLTNIASWLESDDTRKLLQNKVNSVWIMGGNIPSENTTEPEFNFATDPGSMSKVLHHEILRDKIVLVPAQTCERQSASKQEWDSLIERGKEGNGVISKVLLADSSWDDLKFDSLCAFAYAKYYAPNGAINCKTLSVSVDNNTGLLLAPASDQHDDAIKIKFVTDISVNDDFGFLAWFGEAIEAEQRCS